MAAGICESKQDISAAINQDESEVASNSKRAREVDALVASPKRIRCESEASEQCNQRDALLEAIKKCAVRIPKCCCQCVTEVARLRKEVEEWKERAQLIQKYIDKYKNEEIVTKKEVTSTRTIQTQCSFPLGEEEKHTPKPVKDASAVKAYEERTTAEADEVPEILMEEVENEADPASPKPRPTVAAPALSPEDRVKEWLQKNPVTSTSGEDVVCISSDDEGAEEVGPAKPWLKAKNPGIQSALDSDMHTDSNCSPAKDTDAQTGAKEAEEGDSSESLQRLVHPLQLPGTRSRRPNSFVADLKPTLSIVKDENQTGCVILTWDLAQPSSNLGSVTTFELLAYQETDSKLNTWKKIRGVAVLPMPMSCRVNVSQNVDLKGIRYWFAVRAELQDGRFGTFSDPKRIEF